jgi:hypothetical protein
MPVSASGYVHVSGQQLLDGNDQPIQLKGVAVGTWLLWEHWLMGGPQTTTGETNMLGRLASLVGQSAADQFKADYQSQFITQTDFQAIASQGFNVVRVSFNARYLDWTYLDNAVSWAQAAGLYVVLDMHAAPCSQNPYFTSDSTDGTAALWIKGGCKTQAVNAWQQVASRYAGNTTVAAYDLLNEPDGLAMSNAALIQEYRDMIAAIRSVDANHVVMVEGRNYTKDVSPFTSPLDPNLVLSIHQYASSTPNPGGQISSAITAAGKLGGVPIWVGEFGLDTPANVSGQLSRFASFPQIVGWSYWTWKMAARSDNQDGLNEYQAPASWVTLLNWMANKSGAAQPSVAQAQQGMSDFLAAIHQTTPNTGMLAVLTG